MQVLHFILCEEMTQLQAKTWAFFQFLGHNVPINCSKLLGVKQEMKPLRTHCAQLYLEVSYMYLCSQLTKLQRKENFDRNPDPDPECILIFHMRSNTKSSSCHALCNKVSQILFG